jgi:hypothetical protein
MALTALEETTTMTDQQPFPAAPPPPEQYGYGYATEERPELEIDGPDRQRRWTVLLRWLLLIPQFIVVFFLGIAAFFVVIVGWFAALFTGRLPEGIAEFLHNVLAYGTRVQGYEMLLVDQYPPFSFTAPGHPVRIDVRPTTLNRLAVLFRIILLIPAYIVSGVLSAGWHTVAFVIWLITLILGRMPDALFAAGAAVLRFNMRFAAYGLMLTPAYPKQIFGDGPLPAGQAVRGTRPLLLDGLARGLVIAFIVIGVFSDGFSNEYWRH